MPELRRMGFQRPLYLVRAAGRLLVAVSLDELCELLSCADDAGHEVELIHAYYGPEPLRALRARR